MTPVERWIEDHPKFTRFYVPAVVTATLIAQLWEMTHR